MNWIRRVRARAMVLALAAVCFAAAAAAPAFAVQGSQTASLDVDRLANAALAPADAASARDVLLRSQAWLDWSRRHPAWRANWNLRTGTAHRLYGSGVRMRQPIVDAASCEAACRDFLAEHAAVTGVRASELRLAAADQRLGRWYVVFEQVVDGLPVRGARADVRVTDSGAVALFGADWHRDPACDRTPRIAPDAALAAATADLGASTDFTHELVILPEPRGTGYVYRLARELRFHTASPRGVWRAWVDAHSGELLRRENEIRHAQLSGHITAQIEPVQIGDPFVGRPLSDTRFNVGAGTTEFGFTDADGLYDVTTAATDTVNVRVRLLGRWGRVFNAQMGTTPTIDARMFPGTVRDFEWTDSNSRASERDAYYHALLAHEAIKDLDPAFTGVDYQMPIVVDIFDSDCNAFYNGLGINFFGESMRCVNTARLANVVYHEYGHGITDHQYRPLAPSGAMHEAFSDYFACTIENQPLVGRGFRGPGTWLRTIDNTNHYPEDLTGEVHRDGLILGGALWDLREVVGRGAADSLFHYARYGRADNFDDYMLDVLVTDDDNGDIYDGTPRFDLIVAAFASHGIGDYSVQITHAPEPDTEDPNKPLMLDAVILSIFALDAPEVLLHYAIDGGAWQSLPMTATGMAVREFAATIPMQPNETEVAYYIAAADIQGHTATAPAAGVAQPFKFRIGADTTPPEIVHDALPDQPVDSPAGWLVRALVSDNLDRELHSVWMEYGVNGTAVTDTVALAPGESNSWSTSFNASVNLGDNFSYRLIAVDSAQVANVALDPDAGFHVFDFVAGIGRDLDADDGGLTGSGDWEWGEPLSGPPAFTGTNVWGTGIFGSYTDDTQSLLELGPIDLTTWTKGALVFEHWLDCEVFFDGGHVQISTDGAAWTTIAPSGGYPAPFVLALADAGFNGDSQGWQHAEFDLSQWVGQPVYLRFRFASDSGVTGPGWFVDDIQVVARQVLSVPLGVQTQSGLDSQVPIAWAAPAGIDPQAPGTPLQGYNVYRGSEADLSDAVRLNASPLPPGESSYDDATAVNGVISYYAVTALYADGESDPSAAAEGQAYVAGYSADVAALDVLTFDAAPVDTAVTFTNTGTGFLQMNVWLGEASDTSIDQVRIAYERQPVSQPAAARPAWAEVGRGATPTKREHATATAPAAPKSLDELLAAWRGIDRGTVAAAKAGTAQPLGAGSQLIAASSPPLAAAAAAAATARGGFVTLFTDTQESGPTPDIKELLAEENPNGETRFRITGYAPWDNPLTDFTLVLGLDVDANRETGDNGGFDYFVLMGAFALNTFGTPAGIVQGQTLVAVPTHMLFPTNSDFLEVGFSLAPVGNPSRIVLLVLAFDAALQIPRDFAPNVPSTASWLLPSGFHVSAPAGVPTPFDLTFPGLVPVGHYAGKLFFETNAPASPVVELPVAYHLAATDVALAEFSAAQEGGDMIVRWRTSRELDVAAFRVHRSRDGGPFEALSPDIEPSRERAYVFHDRDLAPGEYVYRIGEVAPDGSVTLHGSAQAVMTRVVPAVTFLDPAVPNPFNPSTTMRFGIAAAGPADVIIYDTRGRRVRTLWHAAHAEPGVQSVTWDGRDERGVRVASGVYHVRLQTAGRAVTRRVTLVK